MFFVMLNTSTLANAGELPTAERCYDSGYRDGKDYPFSITAFQECDTESKFLDGQNQYEKGFFEGCMSVKGNTRDICGSAIALSLESAPFN